MITRQELINKTKGEDFLEGFVAVVGTMETTQGLLVTYTYRDRRGRELVKRIFRYWK